MRTRSLAMQLEALRIHCARLETELAGYKAMEQERRERREREKAKALALERLKALDALCAKVHAEASP